MTRYPPTIAERAVLFAGAELTVFIILRIALFLDPFSNFNVAGYNVHHLFTGAFLLVIATILLALGFAGRVLIFFAGGASGMVLDEIIYLIATDGSDTAYLTQVSLIGALVLIALTLLMVGIGYYYAAHKRSNYRP